MNETKNSSHQHGTPARDSIRHEPDPYWKGDVYLLPAVLGACTFRPRGTVNVLEIEMPE